MLNCYPETLGRVTFSCDSKEKNKNNKLQTLQTIICNMCKAKTWPASYTDAFFTIQNPLKASLIHQTRLSTASTSTPPKWPGWWGNPRLNLQNMPRNTRNLGCKKLGKFGGFGFLAKDLTHILYPWKVGYQKDGKHRFSLCLGISFEIVGMKGEVLGYFCRVCGQNRWFFDVDSRHSSYVSDFRWSEC